jgi:hypothetical protein
MTGMARSLGFEVETEQRHLVVGDVVEPLDAGVQERADSPGTAGRA